MRTQSEVSFEDSRIQTVSPGKPTTISSVLPAIAAATRPARLASSIAPLAARAVAVGFCHLYCPGTVGHNYAQLCNSPSN
ncbi:MAG: hypothetical protein JWO52_4649 [Gammaproteobacteria bacterium]|nr:hypothetical protein [Gammaproteobacteria bacterium]